MGKSKRVILGSKGSSLRWLVLGLIIVLAFSIDALLKRDVNKQIRLAWMAACAENLDAELCEQRIIRNHDGCFDLAYTSMIFTFGRDRWDSFKLIDYEACMNRDNFATSPQSDPIPEIGI